MNIFLGWGARARGLSADNKGPWGSSGGDGDEPPSPEGSGGPWGEPPRRGKRLPGSPVVPTPSIDEFLRRSRARFGGGGGFPGRPDSSIVLWAILALATAWLAFTSIHSISPGQRGVVTQFGRY